MIVVENLNKSFGEHIVFNNFNLTVEKGAFITLTGASGCGKTTLLNMIGGIERVDSGKIIVDNFDVTMQKNLRIYYMKYVGFLFQNFALVENKTVEYNLNLIQKNARNNISIKEALKQVGMSGKEKQKIYSLSGGEQQRVALARLILKQCSLILADEPTGSLDKDNAKLVISILKSFSQMGKTIIMVTHDLSLIDADMHEIKL